jgi:polyvinyl alcohol dehydrogenase (cytochrome)
LEPFAATASRIAKRLELMQRLILSGARIAPIAICLFLAPAWALAKDGPPSASGRKLYEQFCSTCHDHPKDRIPARDVIARRTPDEVMQALTNGLMRAQAAGLNMNDRVAVATFLTGKPPLGKSTAAESNLCTQHGAATFDASGWNGWGRDLDNTRYQPQPGLTAAAIPHLKVKWAFGYRASYIYGQPTIVGGRLYASSSSGRVYSLDAKTGCTHWTFDAADSVRTALSVIKLQSSSGGAPRLATVFGDDTANVYVLDANSGKLIWKKKLDAHPDARITGAPVFYDQRLYVPVSSLEELSGGAPSYECCKFRGSVAALDARDGKVLWQTYTIDQPAQPYRKTANGTQLYGPAGGSVWSAPTLDPKHNVLYVGTGNSYTDVPTAHTDSILALEMSSGAIRWVNQLRTKDNYVVGCESPASAGKGDCPVTLGPDVDFGTSPILRTLADGRQVLLTGEKSGRVYALDPRSGKQIWAAQVGTGSSLGGIEWGSAADPSQMYAAVSDAATAKPGGLVALRISDGKRVWQADPPPPVCSWGSRNCLAAQSQAVSAVPGAVFSGSQDGHLRAYASEDGHVIWDFDTAQTFQTVNDVPGVGGSLDNGGATVADGMVFVNSGYGRITGQPGNLLLAFSVDGK